MLRKLVPWRYLIRRLALSHGFLDPIALMSKLRLFSQPSEVSEPIELLRAGLIFHARGLLNTKAIQHNLDWIWPYWVERQFDPDDESFIPRSFSVTHVNLTHRNWTAVGIPGCLAMPIVDPRGLVTPHWDGWSIDAWIIADDDAKLIPSRERGAIQHLVEPLAVSTRTENSGLILDSEVSVIYEKEAPLCRIGYRALSDRPASLLIVVRPYNPEGVAAIHRITRLDSRSIVVEKDRMVRFDSDFEKLRVGNHRIGDMAREDIKIECNVGMATAAAVFPFRSSREIRVEIPLRIEEKSFPETTLVHRVESWSGAFAPLEKTKIANDRYRTLYEAAVRTLILLSPEDVFPGPYTYKRFWFRDAAFILNALLEIGAHERVRRAINLFSKRQERNGYFLSQEGEWDSNGCAIWIIHRYCADTGKKPEEWMPMVRAGAEWIIKKRLPKDSSPHAGLLPPGFSAEHLGPNDYYYWDDYWSVAGLRAASVLLADESYAREADDLLASIETSLGDRTAFPASPYRRMDAGAIGSIVCGYPLELYPANEPRLLATTEFLLEKCFVKGGFFQDMIHSGINAYLTLHIAQILFRAGDERYRALVEAVANLASPTGQWPEAIHPRTLGGCMGDGQHAWAAAEWVLMIRRMRDA